MSDLFDFGEAIRALRSRQRVARTGWNGKDMWLRLIYAGNAIYRDSSYGQTFPMQDCIGLKTTDDLMQPGWQPSQADMLADDWAARPLMQMLKVVPKLKIEKSTCGGFLLLRFGDHIEILTMADWSKALAHIGSFEPRIFVPPKVDA